MRNHPVSFFTLGAALVVAALLSGDLFPSRADALTFSQPITAVGRTMDKARQVAIRRRELRQRASRSAIRARPVQPTDPKPPAAAPSGLSDDLLARLRHCESGGRYGANNG